MDFPTLYIGETERNIWDNSYNNGHKVKKRKDNNTK